MIRSCDPADKDKSASTAKLCFARAETLRAYISLNTASSVSRSEITFGAAADACQPHLSIQRRQLSFHRPGYPSFEKGIRFQR